MATASVPYFSFTNSIDPNLTIASNFFGRYDFPAGSADDMTGKGNDGVLVASYTAVADRKGAANNAFTFDGTSGYVFTANSFVNPQVYSINLWFKTTSTAGGVLASFGNNEFTASTSYDRNIYMEVGGRLNFGTYDGTTAFTARSASSYNDGGWHMATAVMSPGSGMTLYLDGTSVATSVNTLSQSYTGWWHIGYEKVSGWANAGNEYFAGTLDDIWIYKIALTPTQITQLYNI
jgi:hypothetical protein